MEKDDENKIVKVATGALIKDGESSLNELAYIINKTPICIKLFDTTGRLRFINKAGAEEHFLKTPEEVANWDYLSSVEPEFVETVKQNMVAALRGEAREAEFKHVPGTSSHEWCRGYMVPLKNSRGETIGVLFSSIDATEQKRSAEKIAKLNEAKNEFISLAAHQLRTPIAALRGYSELLLDKKGEFAAEYQGFIASISQIADNMNDLVSFLLRVVRAEAGAAKFNLVSFDLEEITNEVTRILQSELEAKSQHIKIIKNPDLFPKVITDREAAVQVIQNLISNAIRYSPQKSVIEVSMFLKNSEAQYSVKDAGMGIPKDEQLRIFEKFYRASNAKSKVPYGTGLGLSLAKSFVEAWGGKIWFESEEGAGTAFYITIPLFLPETDKNVAR